MLSLDVNHSNLVIYFTEGKVLANVGTV